MLLSEGGIEILIFSAWRKPTGDHTNARNVSAAIKFMRNDTSISHTYIIFKSIIAFVGSTHWVSQIQW
jgi:hypothetical protein